MKNVYRTAIILFAFTMLLSCGEDTVTEDFPPAKATLSFPENNKDCNEGVVVSDTHSEVTFRWNTAQNADSYTLNITNLENNSQQTVGSKETEASVSILRATAFSWSVTSKSSNSSKTSESAVWKFYNAGPPDENHVPNLATLVSPGMDSKVNEGTVSLNWTGSDIDNDIVSYEVYIDNANPPTTLAGSPTNNKLDVTVTKDLTYYWQVISIDAIGNKSTSEVFSFVAEEGVPVEPSTNLVLDGEMNDTGKWTYKQIMVNSDNAVEHGFENGEYKFIGAAGTTHSNAIIWQEIAVEAGKTYQFDMQARSEGTEGSWLEVYFNKKPIGDIAEEYGEGMDLYIKSFGGDVEGCGNDAFDGSVFDIIKDGCVLPDDSQFDANGNITFNASDLTENGTIFLAIKAGNWNGNFGTGIYIDDVELIEVK
ncbi:hypothetical protein [Lutimonas sp.]|uniref:hypothetical protein n=1 Tax=Lutimonas sp. TaxID=1872403 RepID=UPI003D9B1256